MQRRPTITINNTKERLTDLFFIVLWLNHAFNMAQKSGLRSTFLLYSIKFKFHLGEQCVYLLTPIEYC
jgi:hypothetical protein